MDELTDLFGQQVNTSTTTTPPPRQLPPDSILSQPFKPASSPSVSSSQSTPTADALFDFTTNTTAPVSSPQNPQTQEQGKKRLY